MTKRVATRNSGAPRAARRNARAERLSAALRSNLRRRKAQARARAAEESDPSAAPHDSAGIVDDKQTK